ncbi:MAG TPA: response regulator transcription factor [Pyrinomonadaceae bacterium]|jgi:two-component system, OmpR family, KDP operon response regulator KdpE|nr:response regulator transcription factor [Pyrinomonadaceae bacterium]
MPDKPRILVVDDEPQLTRVLLRSLTSKGYDVRVAGDGEFALQTFHDWPASLVITDLAMPNMGGLELCRKLRQMSEVPIIVLSVRGEEKTKVEALDAGADDYVTKPFGMDELLARIRAALRRQPSNDAQARVLEAGDLSIDLEAHVVTRSGEEVRLTPKEFDLLAHLVRNAGKVLTHRALLGAVWGGDYTEQHEYLRVFIGQLRKKIEQDPSNPHYILTEPWVGYRFNAE